MGAATARSLVPTVWAGYRGSGASGNVDGSIFCDPGRRTANLISAGAIPLSLDLPSHCPPSCACCSSSSSSTSRAPVCRLGVAILPAAPVVLRSISARVLLATYARLFPLFMTAFILSTLFFFLLLLFCSTCRERREWRKRVLVVLLLLVVVAAACRNEGQALLSDLTVKFSLGNLKALIFFVVLPVQVGLWVNR